MADIVNTGAAANDGSGDNLRTSFQLINERFQQLLGTLSQITWAPGLAISATPLRQWTVQSGQAYVATSNHIAGATFAADLAAGRWLAVDVTQLIANLASSNGGDLVGYGIGTLQDAMDNLVSGHGVIVDMFPGATVNDKTQAAVDALEDGGTVVFTRISAPLLTAAPTVGAKVVNFVFPSGHAPAVDMPGMSQEVNLLDIPDSRYVSDEIRSDDVDAQLNGGSFVNGYKCLMYPTANAKGGRQAIVGQVIMNETTPTDNANKRWIGVVGHARVNAAQGGTGTTAANAVGSLFGMNPYAYMGPSATNIRHITGGEVNTYMDTGSTAWFKAGWSIVSLDKAQASVDVGLNIGADGDSPGFKAGVYFGNTNGGRAIGATASFFQAQNYTAAGSLFDFSGIAFSGNILNTSVAQIDGAGNARLGNGAGSVELTFLTSATAASADSRILASGGTASAYGGSLQYQADNHIFSGASVVRPGTDAGPTLGVASFRWNTIFSSSGSISTSDRNQKTDIRTLSEAEIRVARRLKPLLCAFRFADAVQAKGDGARIHVGVIAQDVKAAFEAEGLDPFAYAMLCHDRWEAREAVVRSWEAAFDSDGALIREAGSEVVEPSVPAGELYGVRYDELLAFVVAAL